MLKKPIIAISMGDPAGVGPEVTVKALAHSDVQRCCRPLVVGDTATLREAVGLLGLSLTLRRIGDASDADFDPASPDVLDQAAVDVRGVQKAKVSATAGKAAIAYIRTAAELALSGRVHAIVTGPINKAAIQAAGVHHIGHTEYLAELTSADRVTTMLSTPGLSVVHVTRHLPLKEVAAQITQENVLTTIQLTDAGLRQMGVTRPRLAVAALNPHGGDGGLLGQEEIKAIQPAIEVARDAGIDARGPIPADSVFFRAIRGEFDVVVAMYHDQGHIPIKTHGFERSVTVTLGLPIVRTSVDHGTAFDIAWQGIASEDSMVEAIQLAARLTSGGH
jgi:4-hydroxythreonine-4-phosphate dehydrogenase